MLASHTIWYIGMFFLFPAHRVCIIINFFIPVLSTTCSTKTSRISRQKIITISVECGDNDDEEATSMTRFLLTASGVI